MFDPSGIANWSVTFVDWSEGKWHPKAYKIPDVTPELLNGVRVCDSNLAVFVFCWWNHQKTFLFDFAKENSFRKFNLFTILLNASFHSLQAIEESVHYTSDETVWVRTLSSVIMLLVLLKHTNVIHLQCHTPCRDQWWLHHACGMGWNDLVIYLLGCFTREHRINWSDSPILQDYELFFSLVVFLWSNQQPVIPVFTFPLPHNFCFAKVSHSWGSFLEFYRKT